MEFTLRDLGFLSSERSGVGFVNFKVSRTDDLSEKFYLIAEEVTLSHLESYTSFFEGCEDFVNVTYVFLDAVRLNYNVVYIDETCFPFEFCEYNVEHASVCIGCVC